MRRAADYYQDAAYAPAEVAGLLDELAAAGGLAGAVELAALCRDPASASVVHVTCGDHPDPDAPASAGGD